MPIDANLPKEVHLSTLAAEEILAILRANLEERASVLRVRQEKVTRMESGGPGSNGELIRAKRRLDISQIEFNTAEHALGYMADALSIARLKATNTAMRPLDQAEEKCGIGGCTMFTGHNGAHFFG